MSNKLTSQQIQFFKDKAACLRREWQTRKSAGERKLMKAENELKMELDRLQDQINTWENKAEVLEGLMPGG